MRLAACLKGLLGAGVLAGALAGCGPDYAIYKVQIQSLNASNRNTIDQCRITITDDSGKPVLDHYQFQNVYNGVDVNGDPKLVQGCAGSKTQQSIGTFSYSSSRSSGNLKFTVEAYDANGYDPTDTTKNRVQWAESDSIPVKAYPPEIPVTIAIK